MKITKADLEKEKARLEKRKHNGNAIEIASLTGSLLTVRKLLKLAEERQYRQDNHTLGCELESIAQVLRYRGLEKEAEALDAAASRLK